MAIRYLIASGNVDDPTKWDGGVSVPDPTDDWRSNGFTGTVNVSVTANTVSNKSESSPVVAAGGTFALANGVTLTVTGTPGIIGGNATNPAVTMALGAGNSASIVGAINGGPTTGFHGVGLSGAGTLNITGNINGGISGADGVRVTGASATLVVAGNVVSGTGGGGAANGITASSAAVNLNLTITGDLSCNSSNSGSAVRIDATGSVVVINGSAVGNFLSNGSAMLLNGANCALTFTGPVTGSSAAGSAGISISNSGTFVINGTLTAGPAGPAVAATTGVAAVYVTGPFIAHANGIVAIAAYRWQWIASPVGTYFEVYTDTLGAKRSLYTADYTDALHMPAIEDVRDGVLYGPVDELEGTLAVPPPSSVLIGVPTDDTVGNADLDPALLAGAVWDHLLASAVVADSFGTRLKVAASTSDVTTARDVITANNDAQTVTLSNAIAAIDLSSVTAAIAASQAAIIADNAAQTTALEAIITDAVGDIDMSAILAAIDAVAFDVWNFNLGAIFDVDAFGSLVRNVSTSAITGQQMRANFP